jgi:hypothetical protein
MTSPAEQQTRLDEINRLLQLGLQSESHEGQSTSFNHDTLRAERDRLERALNIHSQPRIFRFGGRNA